MIILICGIPASGKSTFCKGRTSVSFDGFLKDVYDIDDPFAANEHFLESEDEGYRKFARYVMDAYPADGGDLCVDTMFVTRWMREMLLGKLKEEGFAEKVTCLYLLCDLETALARNEARDFHVPEEIVYKTYDLQQYPTMAEGFDEVTFLANGGE